MPNPVVDAQQFKIFMGGVVSANNDVHSDTGEWAELATICSSAETTDNAVQAYSTNAASRLWTDQLDQASWTALKLAATKAAQLPTHDAAIAVLKGFTSVNAPSHNGAQWAGLNNLAKDCLINIYEAS